MIVAHKCGTWDASTKTRTLILSTPLRQQSSPHDFTQNHTDYNRGLPEKPFARGMYTQIRPHRIARIFHAIARTRYKMREHATRGLYVWVPKPIAASGCCAASASDANRSRAIVVVMAIRCDVPPLSAETAKLVLAIRPHILPYFQSLYTSIVLYTGNCIQMRVQNLCICPQHPKTFNPYCAQQQ